MSAYIVPDPQHLWCEIHQHEDQKEIARLTEELQKMEGAYRYQCEVNSVINAEFMRVESLVFMDEHGEVEARGLIKENSRLRAALELIRDHCDPAGLNGSSDIAKEALASPPKEEK